MKIPVNAEPFECNAGEGLFPYKSNTTLYERFFTRIRIEGTR